MMRIEKLDSRTAVPERKRKRVAAYVRVSTEKEMSLNSLENQAEVYTAQIGANPEWEFAGIYEDRGISGTKEMRPAFQQLLTDCREGKIDLILTKSFTRFARNTVVLLSTLRELKALGVDVYFEKDNIHSLSETGEFLITLLAAYAQAESYSASENQKWRIKKAFEEGRTTLGKMTGYRLKNGVLTVVPEEAELVQQIFSDYLSGMGEVAIAKKLTRMGIAPMYSKKLWNRSSIRRILTNEKYTGNMLLQKTYVENYISKKQKKNRGERTQYLVENSHEAIIPKEMFDAVQEEMRKRSEKTRAQYQQWLRRYPFSGIIECGGCGTCYRRKIARAGTLYQQPVWICRTFDAYGKEFCHSQQIPEDILITETMKVLGSDDLETAVPEMLSAIRVPEANHLVYVFRDGSRQDVFWKHCSRKESWTEEMRQKARELAIEQHRRRREGNNNV
ncbi:MAG: recombinase family protein [Lachnospiraceae bacterium]|nr:recombinase family protein [Muribaculaceae bacterium]MCM1411053.1 recombinase family protein [Lachnospiraceae bacterium]